MSRATQRILALGLTLGLLATASAQPAFAAEPTRMLSHVEIAEELRHAIEVTSGIENLRVVLSNPDLALRAPAKGPALLTVEKLNYDRTSGRFSALLLAGSGAGSIDRARVEGRAQAVREFPVLNRRINAGEVITESDLDWRELPASRADGNLLANTQDLIGKTVRRPTPAGQPLRATDVRRPEVIAKGAMVSIVMESPGLLLSTAGRALDSGGAGDTISVMNLQSKRTVEGIVAGPSKVVVQSRGGIILSAR